MIELLGRMKITAKVCHLTSVHPWNDTRIYIKQSTFLAQAGYEVHLVAPNIPEKIEENIQLHSVPQTRKGRLSRMSKTVWSVYQKALQIDADIYHFHDPELIPLGLALKLKGKKVIYDAHEDVPRDILSKDWIPKNWRKLISYIFERIENVVSQKFDAVVAATPFICDRFLEIGCNAVTVNNFPILTELHIPTTSWQGKEQVVCYIGGIWDQRGLFEMIEAIGKTNAQLLLGGTFAEEEQRSQAIAMTGWSSVEELGQINRGVVAQTLAKSIAGLVLFYPESNHINSQPNKMFEYMSASIPIIASDFPLWKEVIEGNQCGICVNPYDTDAIAEAIQWLIDHPYEAELMGENGRKAVEEKYNWEQESKTLLKLYQALL